MSLAKKLWAENEDLAQAALTHPFVQGLRTGNLPRETFQRYIVQDAFFLDAFARSYALALAHSPDQQGIRDFFELLAGVQEELRLHASYAEKWGHQYMEWIRTYSSPDFEALAARLEGLLDRYTTDTDIVHIAYRRAMTLEVAFFEAQSEGIKR